MFKCAVFDLDGTLADTAPDFCAAINRTLTKFGYPTRSREDLLSYIGNGQKMLVTRSLPENARDEETVELCTETYEKDYSENLIRETKEYPEMTEMLRKLKKDGIKLAVVSNKAHVHTCVMVKELFGEDIFDMVFGSGPFARKPDPEAPLYVAKELGVKASECVFVGDSDVDINTAKNAGMYALGVSWGYRSREVLEKAGADKIADSTREMARIITSH